MPMSILNAGSMRCYVATVLSDNTKKGNFHGWLVGLAVSVPATLWLQKVVEAHWSYYFPYPSATLTASGTLGKIRHRRDKS